MNKELVEWHADNIARKVGDGHASARGFPDVPGSFRQDPVASTRWRYSCGDISSISVPMELKKKVNASPGKGR